MTWIRVNEPVDDRDCQILVAEASDRLLGVLVARAATGQRGVLEHAFVDPGYRRQGILRELEIEASTTLRERGCSAVGFELDADNHVARVAWTALGYAPSRESWERPL